MIPPLPLSVYMITLNNAATIEKALALTLEQKKAVGERAAQRIGTNNPEKVVAQLVDFFRKIIEKTNYNAKMLKNEVS